MVKTRLHLVWYDIVYLDPEEYWEVGVWSNVFVLKIGLHCRVISHFSCNQVPLDISSSIGFTIRGSPGFVVK